MGWASNYIKRLKDGRTVEFRPKGNSMQPKIESGQLCTVAPSKDIEIGDIVLCKVKGREYLHLVKAIKNNRYQIANNKGFINGWIGIDAIYGKLVDIQ